MAVFNVSFLNPSLRPSGGSDDGISVLMNQLTILQNQLEKDGYLAPGDYDLLLEQARKLETTPGLSSTERSRVQVKISEYESQKSNTSFDRTDDLKAMNNTVKSEGYEDTLMAGNNPSEFLNGRIASLQSKLENLNEIIDRKQTNGDDYTEYFNEYQSTIVELQDRYAALDGINSFDGQNPVSGYIAYVTTNNKGEIVDVDYNRFGAKGGYVETNGMINGMQIYAKPNKKENGMNVFVLGKNRFVAPDAMIPDPNNPGSFKTNRLVEQSFIQKGPDGQDLGIDFANPGFKNILPEEISTQSYIPENTWARGTDGTLYQRMTGGGYKKYINATPEDLNIDASRILAIPRQYEQGIMRQVSETVDGAAAIQPDQGMDFMGGQGGLPASATPRLGPTLEAEAALPRQQAAQESQGQTEQVRNRATQPTERAPQAGNFMQNAMRTAKSATAALTSVFRR